MGKESVEIMKNKKMVFGTMLFLLVLIGSCNVITVSATEEFEMPPSSYYATGFEVSSKDTLEIYVSSSGVINVYVMDENQYNALKDSDGSIWSYYVKWEYKTLLETTYTIRAEGVYYVVLYNEDILYGRTVNLRITVDHYTNIDRNIFFFVVLPIAVIIIIIIGIIIFKLPRRISKKKVIVQEREVPKITYCSECGTEIDKERTFCPNCGSKIKN